MKSLKYKIIKTRKQYNDYCKIVEELVQGNSNNKDINDEVELLTLLIEKWDEEHNSFAKADPISILKFLMDEHKLKSKDLVDILGVSKGLVSDILNYKKGLSKESIRKIATHFKISQEAFNKPYQLDLPVNPRLKNAG